MMTAAALAIGVALVTLVTVVATGLKDTTRGELESRIAASHVITGADGWSPTDPAVRSALERGGLSVTTVRQDRGLAFGDKATVNTVDGDGLRFDWAQGDDSVPGKLGADGAVVDEGWASEHGLTVGDSFALTSADGTKLDLTVRGIEQSPVIDAMGLGPVTIGTAAYDRAFANRQSVFTFAAGGDPARALSGLPDTKTRTVAAFVDEQLDLLDQLLAILYVLLALAVIVSLFGIVNMLVLATFERTQELGTLGRSA
jgi:putative ABC transport system permease protein